jgi:hypothetical protein
MIHKGEGEHYDRKCGGMETSFFNLGKSLYSGSVLPMILEETWHMISDRA